MGPRLYNLFPLLFGPVSEWDGHLARIALMNFDWLYLNPLHTPGFSGSLYAVKDYYTLNPLISSVEGALDQALVPFIGHAKDAGLRIMMDLVINHTAKDSLLVERHREWFAHEVDGTIRSPHAIDPTDASKVTVWGDLAEIDYENPEVRAEAAEYWCDLVRHNLQLGIEGFRCDAAYKVPAEIWKRIIDRAKQFNPNAIFAAETLGCRIEQVESLASAGFDYFFNSVKWWDLSAPWALEQYERFRGIAPSIGFADNHDTARLAAEPPHGVMGASDVKRFCEMRYAMVACFSAGVQMTGGFEFGFRRPLHVVNTRPTDWEQQWFNSSDTIGKINRAKMDCPALNEDGPMTRIERDGCVVLIKRTKTGNAQCVFVVNPSAEAAARLNLESILEESCAARESLRCSLTGLSVIDLGSFLDLCPLDWHLLTTTREGSTPHQINIRTAP